MTAVKLDDELLDGLVQFIADKDVPPQSGMSYDEAVNVIVRDWLMGQGYIPLPGDDGTIVSALDAADVPKVPN